ncbi:mannose-1-phosphate guanylyltransferase [Flammeovirgaceae bacterium SG7u.111]|nr:mannose-1-phosphate guanylyltransferase [Flammeovirgaceae bacterium SG7u.132]WPO35939.1 mannose-1-phosphate guanylyltransferase [Flammeovirgaceae bacterium SG7u.111]
MKNNYVIIMAGGIGSRFWPFSRKAHPKQFQDILGTGKTLLQQTAERFEGICPPENMYIVTNDIYFDLVKEQLPFMEDDQILLEPVMRNTAPCIAYASYKIAAKNPDANLVVTPADHIITKEEEFKRVVNSALNEASQHDILVTLGIQPSRPDTGYGYIQVKNSEQLGPLNKVKTFTEKPNEELAKEFVESGDFVWNAGIFIWKASSIIKAFETYSSEIGKLFSDISDKYYTPEEKEAIKLTYFQCKNISIDYGIMEKAQHVYVMRGDFGWSDLGTWKSLFEISEHDEKNNLVQANTLLYETSNTLIKVSDPDKLVVIQGLDDYIVAEKDNVLLICKKDQEQRIKQFVSDCKEQKGKSFH